MRLAIQPLNSTGYIVQDNIKGTFSFDGMSIDMVTINNGFNGDGALFNRQAMKIGLTNASASNLQFTLGGYQGKVSGSGLQQSNLLTYQATGAVKLTGTSTSSAPRKRLPSAGLSPRRVSRDNSASSCRPACAGTTHR